VSHARITVRETVNTGLERSANIRHCTGLTECRYKLSIHLQAIEYSRVKIEPINIVCRMEQHSETREGEENNKLRSQKRRLPNLSSGDDDDDSGICLEGLGKTSKTLSPYSRCHVRYSNRVQPET
jgi:hypothetical protein